MEKKWTSTPSNFAAEKSELQKFFSLVMKTLC